MNGRLELGLRSSKSLLACAAGLSWFLLSPAASSAKVFYAKDEALKIAFPGADLVEMRTFFLKDSELERARELARTGIDSKLFTFYVGKKQGTVMGYAAIDTHVVRTLPETFMVVLSPAGQVRMTLILAFHEPPEYLSSERWLEQFKEKGLASDLRVGRDIAGIAGSTLTTRAITKGIRKVHALFEILIKEKR